MHSKQRSSSQDSSSARMEKMAEIIQRSGIAFSPVQISQLWTYHQLLRQHNSELNLTRIHNFTNMVLKLYVDSILPGLMIALPSPLLDLGTGPGMPGVPLKIAYPHLEVWLAESRKKRVDFLTEVVERIGFKKVQVIGEGINREYEVPVAGVITRAVGKMCSILDRVHGCLVQKGLMIFMKGPRCDQEVEEALAKFGEEYRLLHDLPYRIPHTPHERRLVVFERVSEPSGVRKEKAMTRHGTRKIESQQNEFFKDLRKLLTGRGIRKEGKAIVSGSKQTREILRDFPQRCLAWISSDDDIPPPPETPAHLAWYQLAPSLFREIDIFGTRVPLLLIKIQEMNLWDPADGFPEGCSVLIPFQDPENIGAVVRSAAAFGVAQVVLLEESAHPYHPKALRASGGAVLRVKLLQGPSLHSLHLQDDLPLVPLSAKGKDISTFEFPKGFGLLPGVEGPGLPEGLRDRAVSIPIRPGVESLNAATATAIALFVWSRSAGN